MKVTKDKGGRILLSDCCWKCVVIYKEKALSLETQDKKTTSITQPLDMGLIKAFKDHYNNSLVDFLATEEDDLNNDPFKNINIKNAIVFTSIVWELISKESIINCFKKAFSKKEETNQNMKIHMLEEDIEDVIVEVYEENLSEPLEKETGTAEICEKVRYDKLKLGWEKLKELENVIEYIPFDVQKEYIKFRMQFNNFLRKEFKFGKTITDYFKKLE